MSVNLPLQTPTAPEGFCSTLGVNWVQQLLNLFGQSVAVFGGNGTILLNQENVPDSTERAYLWRRPSVGFLIFQWDAGAWVCPHPVPAGSPERRWFEGTLVELETYDGGSVGAVGTNSGPMWEEDTAYQGRSPMGPGTIPNATPSKTLSVSESYGSGQDITVINQLPAAFTLAASLPMWKTNLEGTPPSQWLAPQGTGGGGGTTENGTFPFVNSGGDQPHTTLHPVRGIYCVRRTNRQNYVAS